MKKNNLTYLSTDHPTYWPTDKNRMPVIIDFCVTKGINTKQITTESCLDLSSDHSPISITRFSKIVEKQKQPTLYSKNTDWEFFRERLDSLLSPDMPLKSEYEIDTAVQIVTETIQNAAWQATPDVDVTKLIASEPLIVKKKVAEKRRIRRQWQRTRSEGDKRKLNKISKELKKLLENLKNQEIEEYLRGLSASEANDYSL